MGMQTLTADRVAVCHMKIVYRSAAVAWRAVQRMGGRGKRRAYHCKVCGQYHLTSNGPVNERAERRDRKWAATTTCSSVRSTNGTA